MQQYKQFKNINFFERYVMGQTVAQGHFGPAKVIKHKTSNAKFMCTVFNKEALHKQQVFTELLKGQFTILGQLSHPHISGVVDLIENEEHFYVVTEMAKGGELFDRQAAAKYFTEG